MKKYISIILTLSLLILASACDKDKNNGKPILYVGFEPAAEVVEVLPGGQKTIVVKVYAEEGHVPGNNVNLTLKVDAGAVAGTSYTLFPESSYEFQSMDVMMAKYGKSSSSATLKLSTTGLEYDVTYALPIVIDKVEGVDEWEVSAEKQKFLLIKKAQPKQGSGTQEDPYLLYEPKDLEDMHDLLSDEKMVYFRMEADIDMSGINDWEPLNWNGSDGTYNYAIDFDGNDHIISNLKCEWASYSSFFGVLYGSCHDVTFTNAIITCAANSGCGILGGYCGTGDKHGEVNRVHVQGTVELTGSKTGVGGMFGVLGNGTITASSADVVVSSPQNYVGGIFGYSKQDGMVSDCWTSGDITGNQRVGGIGGGTDKSGTGVKVINCYSTAKVHGGFALGGIGGHFNLDQSSSVSPMTTYPDNTFQNCIAWNEEVRANSTAEGDLSHYSCGMVVGYTSANNTLVGCIRRPDAVYNTAIFFDYSDAFSLYDQNDASASSPLQTSAVENATFNFPYHGKAAPAGATVSSIAQGMGWSAEIWDFNSDLPKLR